MDNFTKTLRNNRAEVIGYEALGLLERCEGVQVRLVSMAMTVVDRDGLRKLETMFDETEQLIAEISSLFEQEILVYNSKYKSGVPRDMSIFRGSHSSNFSADDEEISILRPEDDLPF